MADEVGAGAVVLGTRGLTGLKSLLFGSVSHAEVRLADRPVLVVRSLEFSARRAANEH